MKRASTISADILAAATLSPGPRPVSRPAPASVAQGDWTAYRLDEAAEQLINPPDRLKRLGRGQAMAIGTVQRALATCAEIPERGSSTAVAVGSSVCEEGDEIAFLQKIIELGEKAAKPAYFVNSVKNALASQLALTFGWQGENQTFFHGGLSFESALWQGARLLCAGRAHRAVVCGVDSMVELQEMEGHLLGFYRSDVQPLEPLAGFSRSGSNAAAGPAGTIPGEGGAALVMAARGTVPSAVATLLGVRLGGPVIRSPAPAIDDEVAFVQDAASAMGLELSSVGLVLVGANGDAALDAAYAAVSERLLTLAPKAGLGVYRHQTGDFPVASGLGLALAVRAVSERAIPPELRLVAPPPAANAGGGAVLLYHLTAAGYHSVMAVAAPS